MTLGDALGRLVDPPTADRYDRFRLAMVDQLFAAERGEAVAPAAWYGAFENAVSAFEEQLIADSERALRAAAAYSRYPASRLSAVLPNAARRDALRNRLLAAGMPLEQLERQPDDAMTGRQRGVALETAWEGVQQVARGELAYWSALTSRIREWRRPTTPLWIATGILICAAMIVAAWLGGQLDSPGWFEPVAKWWWGWPIW